MSYKIMVTRVETEEYERRGEHELIAERPLTNEDMEDAYHNGELVTEANKNGGMIKVYGNTESYMDERTKEIVVYTQDVQNLNLPAVILAVNNLEGGE